MGIEADSYKEMQMWEIITRLKKLEGDDLESIVRDGIKAMFSAVKLSVDSAENPYEKRHRIEKRNTPSDHRAQMLSARQQCVANNLFYGLRGAGQAAVCGGTLGMSMGSDDLSLFGW